MNTFPIKFMTVCTELDMLVTASEKNRRFKVELVTGEPNPLILRKSESGEWSVEQPGGRAILENRYEDIGASIDEYLQGIDD